MARGAGCRELNPRLRRREKNVLDISFYRSGVTGEKLSSGNFNTEFSRQLLNVASP
jgi:hypothetical protein